MKHSPTTKQKRSIKPGDLFALGCHRLLCDDTRDAGALSRLAGSERITAVIVDVPYGVGYVESKADFYQKISAPKTIVNDHVQGEEEYRRFTKEWLEAVKPHLAKKNSLYIFNSDKMLFALRAGMVDAGCKFGQLLIWLKNHAVVGRMDYLPQHELIAYGWYGTHEFRKSKDKSVLFCPKPNRSPLHPTQKPVGLIRRLILNSTNIGNVVYDGFSGSGTTLIACEQTRRKCLMMEIDPEYCLTIVERWEKFTGLQATRVVGKEEI